MWVRCAPDELELRRKERGWRRVKEAAVCAALMSLFLILVYWERPTRTFNALTPGEEWLSRAPAAIAVGALVWFLLLREKPRPTVICPKCEATKYHDGILVCQFGGRFEKVDELKWVESESLPK